MPRKHQQRGGEMLQGKPVVLLESVDLVASLRQLGLNELRLLSLHRFHLLNDLTGQNLILLLQPSSHTRGTHQ